MGVQKRWTGQSIVIHGTDWPTVDNKLDGTYAYDYCVLYTVDVVQYICR